MAMTHSQSPDKTMTALQESLVEDSLNHDFWLARWRAIQVLRESSEKNDQRAVLLLIEKTQDNMIEVVVSALEALGEICTRGNELVTMSILNLLGHKAWQVRHATICCLEKVAPAADQDVYPAVLSLLEDSDASTRLAALSATLVLGAPKDPSIVTAAVKALKDDVEENREAAVGLLKQFAHRGDPSVVEGLEHMCMHDASPRLRLLAGSSLGHWASNLEAESTSAMLVRQLESKDREIGRAAVVGMLTRLRSKDGAQRAKALRSLTQGLSPKQATQLSLSKETDVKPKDPKP